MGTPLRHPGGRCLLLVAYDLATQPACGDGRKLVALILHAVCERVGHAAAAAIALLFGLISLAYALREGRED